MNYKSIIFSILILLSGVTAYAQDHQHTAHLNMLLKNYMDAKDALAEDNFETARSHLSEFRSEVINNDEMNNHDEHSQMHASHHRSMIEAVNDADQADDLKVLRLAFKDITANLVKALENQDYSGETLYLQYCPMAASNEGAEWISDQEKIINPYMGKKMPSCGKTEKEINPDN